MQDAHNSDKPGKSPIRHRVHVKKALLCPRCGSSLQSRIVYDSVSASYVNAWICECEPSQAKEESLGEAFPVPANSPMPKIFLYGDDPDQDDIEELRAEQARSMLEALNRAKPYHDY